MVSLFIVVYHYGGNIVKQDGDKQENGEFSLSEYCRPADYLLEEMPQPSRAFPSTLGWVAPCKAITSLGTHAGGNMTALGFV